MRASIKNILKFVGPMFISLMAGYLAFRGVHFGQVVGGIERVNLMLLLLVVFPLAFAQVLRSLRWGLLLQPLQLLSQRLLLPITCIGFLFIWVLPARLGEVARPYLLQQNSNVGLSAAAGSVVLERLVDASFLVGLMAITLPRLELPGWVVPSIRGFTYVLAAAIGFLAVGSLPAWRSRFLRLLLRFLPDNVAAFLARVLETFYSGMQAVGSLRRVLAIFFLTLVIWGLAVIANLVMFQALDMKLGWTAAVTVLVLSSIGIALPAAPAFIGNYHFGCVVALNIFAIGKDSALAFAILLHLLVTGVIVLMGIFFLNTTRLKVGFPVRRQEFAGKQ